MSTSTLLFSSSCNIINPAEPVPAYVHVDYILVSTSSPSQGSASSRITDSWVFVDGTLLGVFENPATVPALYAGTHQLTIRPGILIDGISSTRTFYPFYNSFDTTVNFESEKTVSVRPVVSYTSSVNFVVIEDFDGTGNNFTVTPGSDTTLTDTLLANGLEGRCGAVHLDAAHPLFGCTSIDSFPLPLGAPVYAELNYMCENEFTVGLISYTTTGSYTSDIVTFRPSDTWKKVYVSLGPYITGTTNDLRYRIYLKAVKSPSLATPSLYFDNIKVLY